MKNNKVELIVVAASTAALITIATVKSVKERRRQKKALETIEQFNKAMSLIDEYAVENQDLVVMGYAILMRTNFLAGNFAKVKELAEIVQTRVTNIVFDEMTQDF